MAEYIEREAIEYPYMTMSMWGLNSSTCKAYNEGVKAVEDYIATLPAADVVEVVRCKNCRYGEPYLHHFYCENSNAPWAENTMANIMDANDFCSYGERKCEDG